MSRHADELVARRDALVIEAQVQRLRWRDDLRAAAVAMSPSTLLARVFGQAREHPSSALVALLGAVALRRFGAGGLTGQALLAWRVWSALRNWLQRPR